MTCDPLLGSARSCRCEYPLKVVFQHDCLKCGVVEYSFEDVRVVVHATYDALDEPIGEDQSEVLDGVRPRLGDQMVVGQPSRLELIEEELVRSAKL